MVVSEKERNAQVLAAIGLTGGLATIIANLMRPKEAAGAEALDLTDVKQALAALLVNGQNLQDALNTANNNLDVTNDNLQLILDAIRSLKTNTGTPKDPVTIFSQSPRAVTLPTEPLLTEYVDFRYDRRLVLKVESTLDQAVTVQMVGDIQKTQMFRQIPIGLPVVCPAGGNASVEPDFDDWFPYIGMQITVLVAPTLGDLRVFGALKNVD